MAPRTSQKIRVLIVSVLSALVCPVWAGDVPNNHVLVIGVDGTRPDCLTKANTPNFDALIQAGAYAETTQILGERYQKNDTVSGPGWSSFLTGVWADKHGVNDNSFQGKNYEAYPHFFTRLKQCFPKAHTGSFVDWKPIDDHIVSDADVREVFESHGADEYTVNDQRVCHEAVRFLSEENPHAVMVYFGAIDETGHRYGFHPSVPEYIRSIETVDQRVGQLLSALRARPNSPKENWLVVISTDHGGQGTGHSGGHNVPEIRTTFLIVSGPSARKGVLQEETYVVDVAATALTHLGCEIDKAWGLDGHPRGLITFD
ncbi:MAG: alkaline phosphatase family protein [Planctomycetaceae bacterium]|nr:alkaline phosphatase family protein [Planctomycetaceae bacterium]